MRAIVYSQPGASSVLRLVEREKIEPGAGEVRVRIVVSGVNPTDWKSRSNNPVGGEVSPNQDGAGVVDAIGEGVTDFTVGDRVWTLLSAWQRPSGTAQEFVVLPVERVAPLPDGVSFDVGASLGVPAVTAHRALTISEDGPSRLHPGALNGQVVLVAGGAGAVGHAAIQLAAWAGATVISTVSSDAKAALATAAGADHVIDYTAGDTAATIREIAPDGVNIIVEVSAAANIDIDLAVAAPRASIAVYADNGGNEVVIPIRSTFGLNLRVQFVLLYTVGQRALDVAKLDVTAAAAAGALEVGDSTGLPLHRFALEQTAAAHDAVEESIVGKVLIDVTSA